MMPSASRLGAGAFVLATFFAGAAQANLVTNPGFEVTGVPGPLPGWTLSGDTVDVGVEFPFAHFGRFSAFLVTCIEVDEPRCLPPTGSISQTLATTEGAAYDIEFWLVAEVRPNFFTVSFGDVVLDTLIDISTLPDEGECSPPSPIQRGCFTLFRYTALASSASTDLVFTFQSDIARSHGFNLDDVIVTAAPESGSLPLVAVGLISLLAMRRGSLDLDAAFRRGPH